MNKIPDHARKCARVFFICASPRSCSRVGCGTIVSRETFVNIDLRAQTTFHVKHTPISASCTQTVFHVKHSACLVMYRSYNAKAKLPSLIRNMFHVKPYGTIGAKTSFFVKQISRKAQKYKNI